MKVALLALASVAFATSAFASTAENPLAEDSAVLNLRGLDLSSADGQQRLAIRMDQAARAVCGDRLASVHLSLENQAEQCRTAVVADVRAQVEARMASASTGSSARFAVNR